MKLIIFIVIYFISHFIMRVENRAVDLRQYIVYFVLFGVAISLIQEVLRTNLKDKNTYAAGD